MEAREKERDPLEWEIGDKSGVIASMITLVMNMFDTQTQKERERERVLITFI